MLASMTADEVLHFIAGSFSKLEKFHSENGEVIFMRNVVYATFKEAEEFWRERQEPTIKKWIPRFEGWLDSSEKKERSISGYVRIPFPTENINENKRGYALSSEHEEGMSEEDETGSAWLLKDILTEEYFNLYAIEDDLQKRAATLKIYPDWFITTLCAEVRSCTKIISVLIHC